MLTEEVLADLTAFFEKHKIDFAILLLPTPDGGLKAALHGVDEQQMWLVCQAVCEEQMAGSKDRKLNG